MVTVARFRGGVRLFWHIAIFSETNSSYAEFSGEKEEESVIAISLARENLSSRFFWSILGLFDLLEPMEQVLEPSEIICR